MNNGLQQKRLLFEVARKQKQLALTPKDVIVNKNPNPSYRCKNGREEFAFIRNNSIINIDNVLLEENTRITPELLIKSTQRVIAEHAKTNESTLSA